MRLLGSPLVTGAEYTGAEGAEGVLLWSTLLCGGTDGGTTTKEKKVIRKNYGIKQHSLLGCRKIKSKNHWYLKFCINFSNLRI